MGHLRRVRLFTRVTQAGEGNPCRFVPLSLLLSQSVSSWLDVVRLATTQPRYSLGIQAPLGWTLSSASFDDLRAQLMIVENVVELSEIQTWLTGRLTCDKSD